MSIGKRALACAAFGCVLASATAARAQTPYNKDDGSPDHDRVIGHIGVGYFGFTNLPIAQPNANGVTPGTVTAPIIGVRYWLNRLAGIDAGVGLGLIGGSTQVNNVSADKQSQFGLVFHGGVPLALARSKHFTWEVVPELNLGFTNGTIPGGANPDTSLSGLHFDIGARAGAEIHFGFIGLPDLSLEGSVGLYFTHESVKASVGGASASDSTNTFGTGVGADPWALFVNKISARYYF